MYFFISAIVKKEWERILTSYCRLNGFYIFRIPGSRIPMSEKNGASFDLIENISMRLPRGTHPLVDGGFFPLLLILLWGSLEFCLQNPNTKDETR